MRTMQAKLEDEVREIRSRLDKLEMLIVGLLRMEFIDEDELTPRQKKLYRATLADIEKKDYRNFLSLEDLKAKLKATR